MRRKVAVTSVSLALFLLAWHVGSLVDPSKFPPPLEVFSIAIELLNQPGPRGNTGLYHLQVTFARVFAITLLVLIVSVIIGVLMGTQPRIEAPLGNILPVWLTVPSVVAVLIGMVMFNFSNVSVVAAVAFVTIPFGILNTYEGTKAVDSSLLEMAYVFEVNRSDVWRHVYIPSILPYLFASSRYLLGMIWKITLLAETFGISAGVGAMIRFWYTQGDLTTMLGYFTMFAVTVLAIEYLLLAPAEKRAFAWRSD